MPLWKGTAQALGVLFSRCGEEIWPIFKVELDGLFEENRENAYSPSWAAPTSRNDQSYQEDEKTWRNPGLNETISALDGMGQGMAALAQVRRPNSGKGKC